MSKKFFIFLIIFLIIFAFLTFNSRKNGNIEVKAQSSGRTTWTENCSVIKGGCKCSLNTCSSLVEPICTGQCLARANATSTKTCSYTVSGDCSDGSYCTVASDCRAGFSCVYSGGNCSYTCNAGYVDCNLSVTDGCECNIGAGYQCSNNVCLKPNGVSCTSGTECISTYCVDGYCCNSACGGNCDRCNVAGSLGTCTNVDADCTGNCDVCSAGNCAANQNLCSACYDCSGSGTSFNCSAVTANTEDTVGTNTCAGPCKYCASGGSCITVTCNEETIGTTCSGSNVCNDVGSCVSKTADGGACKVGNCTACSPSTSCIFCSSNYCTSSSVCGSGCNLNTSGNVTLSSSCTLFSSGYHLSGGDLTIASGGSLTIQSGASLTIDAGHKILISGGTINMQGGQIFIGI